MGDTTKIAWEPLKFLFMMDEALQEQIYYEYGFYCRHNRGLLDTSVFYINESLKHSQRPKKPIFKTANDKGDFEDTVMAAQHQYLVRSQAELDLAEPEIAKNTMLKGLALDPENPAYNLQHMFCVHQNKEIEESYKLAFNSLEKKHTYKTRISLNDLINQIRHNFDHSIGDSAGKCLINQLNIIKKFQSLKAEIVIDDRPRWVQLLKAGICDTDSNWQEEAKLPTPLSVKRKKQRNKILNSRYFGMAAHDINFLKSLESDSRINSSPKPDSTEKLKNIITETNKKVIHYRDYLQVQQPLYSILHLQYRNPADLVAANKQNMLLLQYKSFKETMKHLDQVHERRYNVAELTSFIDDIINNYYTIKTRRVLPRKFEIMSEIFNIYAVTILSCFHIPEGVEELTPFKALIRSMDPNYVFDDEIKVQDKEPEFGKRSKKRDPNVPDPVYMANVAKLEKTMTRLKFALYPVERCYLMFQIATLNFKILKYDEVRNVCHKIITIHAAECRHWVYKFLAFILEFKASALRGTMYEFPKYFKMGNYIVQHLDEQTQKYYEQIYRFGELALLDFEISMGL